MRFCFAREEGSWLLEKLTYAHLMSVEYRGLPVAWFKRKVTTRCGYLGVSWAFKCA